MNLLPDIEHKEEQSCVMSNGIQNYSYNYRFQSDTNSSYSNYIFNALNASWNALKGTGQIGVPTSSWTSQLRPHMPISSAHTFLH